jgi:DNA (cytosine-5)-methyltransferase 1
MPVDLFRKRELADATKRRIAHGVVRYVINAAKPFIVSVAHGYSGGRREYSGGEPLGTVSAGGNAHAAVDVEVSPFVTFGQQGGRNRAATDPLHTATASSKDTNGIVGATLVGVGGRRGQSAPMPVDGSYPTTTAKADSAIACATLATLAHGERRPGEPPRQADLSEPLSTTHAGGGNHAAVTAFLSSFYTSDKAASGGDPERPLRTARAGGQHHAIVAAHVEQANTGMVGHTPRKPLSTIVGKGCTQRIIETTMIEEGTLPPEMMDRAVRVAAFLVKYYATDGENEAAQSQRVDRQLDTITTLARFAVVTVTIDAKTYVIVDIGLRMLKPRELARAQGFPDSYILNPVVRKFLRGKWVERPLTIAEQINAIGNSVCPPVARALVAANQPSATDLRLAA